MGSRSQSCCPWRRTRNWNGWLSPIRSAFRPSWPRHVTRSPPPVVSPMRTSGVRWSLSGWSQVRLLRVAVTKGRVLKPLSMFHNSVTVYRRAVKIYPQDWKLYPQQSSGCIRGLPEQEPPWVDTQVDPAAIASECCGDILVCAVNGGSPLSSTHPAPPHPTPLPEGKATRNLPQKAPPSPVEREEQDTLFLAPHSDTIGLSWVERTLNTTALPTRRQDDGVRMDQHPR